MRSAKSLAASMLAAMVVMGVHGQAIAAVPRPAVAAGVTQVERSAELATGWAAVEQTFGTDIAAHARRIGISGGTSEQLPSLPWAMTHALKNVVARPALEELSPDNDQDDGVAEGPDDEPAQALVSTRVMADVNGDGTSDLWIVKGLTGSGDVGSVVDGATGALLWGQQGHWSSRAPVVSGDADGDGTLDLAASILEFVDARQIEDFEGEERESGFELTLRTGVAMLSGATGDVLWQESDTEVFGLAFYGRYTTTEYAFGIRIWMDDALLSPDFLDRTHAGELVLQRVDQRASGEVGSKGVFVWNEDPWISGVGITDTAKVSFTGATHARLVDPRDGTARREFTTAPGFGVSFLVSAPGTARAHPDLLWVTFALPEQRMECVQLHCLENPAANRAMTVEVYGPDGGLRWQDEWAGRYSTGLWYGSDVSGDGVHDLLLEEVVPSGETYEVQLASVSGADGAQHWRTSRGTSAAEVVAVAGAGAQAVVLLSETRWGIREFGVSLHRVQAGTGAAGPTTRHDVEYVPHPDDPLGLQGTPYVQSTSSSIWLDTGGDTDGDGVDDVLVSLAQRRRWSDKRADTYWGGWTVESGATGEPIHAVGHTEQARVVSGWADTSGDGHAEFVERSTASATSVERDGRSAAALWTLGPGSSVVADLDGDGVAEVVTTADGAGTKIIRVLDGPTHEPRWELVVPVR